MTQSKFQLKIRKSPSSPQTAKPTPQPPKTLKSPLQTTKTPPHKILTKPGPTPSPEKSPLTKTPKDFGKALQQKSITAFYKTSTQVKTPPGQPKILNSQAPKVVTPQPKVVTPQLKVVTPQPKATTPQTKIITPQPKPKVVQPTPPKPKPVTPKVEEKKVEVKKRVPPPSPKSSTPQRVVSRVKSVTPDEKTPQTKAPEQLRENVRKTLAEHFNLRIKEQKDIKLNEDQVSKLSSEIEYELYNLFNRDTGAKYRNKYRSLIFNIKDAKNQTLWKRICQKVVSPKELVRLSPEELASQELAQWRERETKHQLDMIKKTELDLLSCARMYVLKSHKGEEVIEKKAEAVDSTIVATLDGSLVEDGVDSTSEKPHDGSAKESGRSKCKFYFYFCPRANIKVAASRRACTDGNGISSKQSLYYVGGEPVGNCPGVLEYIGPHLYL